MFCEGCRPEGRHELQVIGIDKFNEEKKNPPMIIPNECWATLTLTMIEKCNGKRDLYSEYEWCWDCTANYFCENATLDLPVVAAML